MTGATEQLPVLSIVTITRNDAAGLERTLSSVAEQYGLDDRTELVVIDGASTDSTPQVVAEHAPPGAVFVSEPDRGVYDAMNKGAARARGRWLQFLNGGDAFSTPAALDALLAAVAANADASWLVAGAVNLRGGDGPPVVIANLPYHRRRHALGRQPHCHQSTLVRRDVFEALGGYSEDFGFAGDFDLILRLGALAPPAELHRVVVEYAGGGISAQLRDEIPALQHRVRVERFGLGRGRAALDQAYTRTNATYVSARRRFSAALRRH